MRVEVLVVLLVSMLGCNNSSKTVSPPKVEPMVVSNTPSWISNPSKEGYICSIGSASLSNINTMQSIAKIKAKANISREINTYINSQSKLVKSSTGKSAYTSISSQQSVSMLNDIEYINNFTDTMSNRYYIRACSKVVSN